MRRISLHLLTPFVGATALLLLASWVASLPHEQPKSSKDLQPSFKGRKGVYLNVFAAADAKKVDEIIEIFKASGLNAVVIDVKDNHGIVAYDTKVPLAKTIEARMPLLKLDKLLNKFKREGIYVIARQVVFYDPKLANYLNSPQAPWVLPSNQTAVQYNLAIAGEVASKGFDEIQFDYLRYPDGGGLRGDYSARYEAINQFLKLVHQKLNDRINISVDVFGRTLWDWNIKKIDPIGQQLEEMAPYVDLLSPMVYPSHYENKGFWDHPYETVKRGLQSGLRRGLMMRPFLQAFEMRIPKTMSYAEYIRAQIRAAEELGFDGYLFWNPKSDYTMLWQVLESKD